MVRSRLLHATLWEGHAADRRSRPIQADKLRAQQQLEQLQARYVGTGHADTTKYEWAANIHRDSYASYVGHPPLLSYMALGMGEPREKVRAQMIEVRGTARRRPR